MLHRAAVLVFFWTLATQASNNFPLDDDGLSSVKQQGVTDPEGKNNKLAAPILTYEEFSPIIEKIKHCSTLTIQNQKWPFRWHTARKKALNFTYTIECINDQSLDEKGGRESFAVYCLYPEGRGKSFPLIPDYIFYLYKPKALYKGQPSSILASPPASPRKSIKHSKNSIQERLSQYLANKKDKTNKSRSS